MSLRRGGTLFLLFLTTAVLCHRPLWAAPISVRFVEGATHGFLALRTVNGVLIATGDLLQVGRRGQIESRMVFRFKDGSVLDESVVFTQQRVFTMQSYHLVRRGPAFTEDTPRFHTGASHGKVPREHQDPQKTGRRRCSTVPLNCQPTSITVWSSPSRRTFTRGRAKPSTLAFTPTPRLIQLELAPAGEHKVLIGELAKTATHYVLRPRLGTWLKLFATLLGRVPPDSHAWIVTDNELPAFVRFEGPLDTTGPVWRVDTTSPRWPDEPR
jgi:hypothetical protein